MISAASCPLIKVIIGGFALALAGTTQPFYNAAGVFSSTGSDTLQGMESSSFQSSIGMFLTERF